MNKLTYYAHSKRIYNTKEEARNIKILKGLGYKVLCPNNNLGELNDIKPYLTVVSRSKDVVCTEYKGNVGKGAFAEIKEALKRNISVGVLRDKKVIPIKNVIVDDPNDWGVHYGKIIT